MKPRMDRRHFLMSSMAAGAAVPLSLMVSSPLLSGAAPAAEQPRVAVLVVDTDATTTLVDKRIYGHFLEHINHSVEDGLFAEQIRGCGFEGDDFKTYWQSFAERGSVDLADVDFKNGKRSVRLHVAGGRAGIRQGRLFLAAGYQYDGSLWVRNEQGSPQLTLRVISSKQEPVASIPLRVTASGWQEVAYSFKSSQRDTQASVEIAVSGTGTLLLDFISMMRSDVRRDGMLRPDLLQAVRDLAPPFIRWPGGSFASTYKWKDGIGPLVSRSYHPNMEWGGYSDYYGFGTDEFLGLCRKVNAEPLIVLPAPGTAPEQVQYAMDWVHYLNDPPSTEWGRLRASNGHSESYGVRYFQIDNEPMNNGFTPERYAEIVNVYGSRLRTLAPDAQIVACGQKRSNDMLWSHKVIDLAGKNFDVLGCHNYEYEPEHFETGLQRIREYLSKLRDYIRASQHPHIQIGVLEWNLSRTYDWRAGLHAAGILMMYEQFSPDLTMTCPALLMRNTTDDPTWTSLIYHDHVSWFPGCAYPVEKLFREHYADRYLGATSGTFQDMPNRQTFFQQIATMIPQNWIPGTVDAIVTRSADGRRIVIKAVNYEGKSNTLLVRFDGSRVPEKAVATLHTLSAGLTLSASLEHPDAIAPVTRTLNYARDLAIDLDPYTVSVVEIRTG
jgi:alpha-N-arabinofuranosidase